jgi:hypothetical protein
MTMKLVRSLAMGTLALFGATSVVAQQAGEPIQAIWKPQELTFHFHSFNTFYSCDSLESKLEQILERIGARAEVKVRSADCGRGPVSSPRADIRLISPVAATPDALAEAKQGESKRELIARITRDRDDAIKIGEQFPAQWQRVTIGAGRATPSLAGGDCELLDQVRRHLLPKLAVRVIKSDAPCPANVTSISQSQLVVEALMAMPKPDDAQASKPGT